MIIQGFEVDKFNQYGLIEGKEKSICPLCSADRKKSTDKCASLDWSKGIGTCFHCNEKIQLHTWKGKGNINDYARPQYKENPLSKNVVEWFKKRGISEMTLNILKVTESKEWMPQHKKEVNTINFNYFRDNELINTKFRDREKTFKMVKDAEKIFYNLDGCRYEDSVIIVEGEIDCLSYVEAGLISVLSVPNGFTTKSINMDYLTNCIEYFENKEKIYIAVDNDEAGINGKNELIRRLGAEKCLVVDFKDCKDANEYLIKYGKDDLLQTLILANPVPLDGVSGVKDFEGEFEEYLLNGMKQGYTIGKPHFDDIFSTYTSQYIVVTGEPSSGKSDWVDEMVIGYNKIYGWKTAYASKENKPNKIHAGKLVAKLSGGWINKQEQIDTSWFKEAKQKLHDDFKFIDLKDSYDLKSVLSKAGELVKRYGIKVLVIDPYNKVRLKESLNKNTNEYTNDYFNEIDDFCAKYDVLVIVVMHPVKVMAKNGVKEEITAYHIKGGGEVYDMTPHILCVDRDYDFDSVSIKVLKVKFHHLGKNKEKVFFKWNSRSGRYSQFDQPITEAANTEIATVLHDNSNWFIEDSRLTKEVNEVSLSDEPDLTQIRKDKPF